ncbi:hypothetical protein GF323_00520 [Candidatus Woesearchaeota archaeon]|nr:hypothetical protein [Candidatus Woesearchaeota archaeon]
MNPAMLLSRYTGKRYIYLTPRGNKSVLLALKIAKAMDKKKVIIQDQGGWITYLQYPQKLKMQLIKLKTDFGIIEPNELSKHLDSESVLLVNSLSGYFAEQPVGLLNAMCRQKNALLINDASGSIGTETAKFGDIIIGSFGEDKPVSLEYGGFIAFDDKEYSKAGVEDEFDRSRIKKLSFRLQSLPERLRLFEKHHNRIKKDLEDMEIMHKEKRGINVIIKFNSPNERERIINYCRKNSYQYTECPRYIRVNADAISIEVKRL